LSGVTGGRRQGHCDGSGLTLGEIVVAPFEFALTETGFAVLSAAISRAQHERDALVIRVGVEAAGHYHRTLVARLRAAGLEVFDSTRARSKMHADNSYCAR
jgi:transposase